MNWPRDPFYDTLSGERNLKMAHGLLSTIDDDLTTTIHGADGDQYLVVTDAESGEVVIEGQTVVVIPIES